MTETEATPPAAAAPGGWHDDEGVEVRGLATAVVGIIKDREGRLWLYLDRGGYKCRVLVKEANFEEPKIDAFMNLVATPWTDGADSVDSDESEDESEDDELKFICFKVDEERGDKNGARADPRPERSRRSR